MSRGKRLTLGTAADHHDFRRSCERSLARDERLQEMVGDKRREQYSERELDQSPPRISVQEYERHADRQPNHSSAANGTECPHQAVEQRQPVQDDPSVNDTIEVDDPGHHNAQGAEKPVSIIWPYYLAVPARRARAARVVSRVKASDSRGMLVTKGPMSHLKAGGMARVSEIDSHCT